MSGLYRRPQRRAWFLERPGYVRFMIREITSFFVAGYLAVFLVTLAKLGGGDAVFQEWVAGLAAPGWVVAHAVALAAALWHAVTWFNAVPQAMPIHVGEERLPGAVAAVIMGYGPWLTVSAVVLWWMLK